MINKITSNKDIKLSVIVPVYNVKQYLNDCLRSLSEQSVQNVEFIIVDDGSTDGSSEICDQWGSQDRRFIVIHQKNQGTLLARRTGILKSKGDKIIFLDGDDMLEKEALHEIFNLIKNCDADIIQFSIRCINYTNKNKIHFFKNINLNLTKNLDIAKSIFEKKIIPVNLCFKIYNSKLLKKSIEKISHQNLISAEDLYYQFITSFYARSLKSFKTKSLYIYRFGIGISTKQPDLYTFIKNIDFFNII